VDGVLTDGSLFYSAEGEIIKRFNVRDGLGVRLLQQIGVQVAVVSGRSSAALARRMADLGIDQFRTSVSDKGQACREILSELSIGADRAIFVGDDVIDIAGFQACGLSAAVADAPDYVRSAATLILSSNGGEGALRELADAIVIAQGHAQLLHGAGSFAPADGGTLQ
jgi:YrbI family 3-deoxy-D-manno-octulosonate 8-phosphate phosphatase